MAFEASSRSLFVAGSFDHIDGESCSSIAVWNSMTYTWRCLSHVLESPFGHKTGMQQDSSSHGFSFISTMALVGNTLYTAGLTHPLSSWHSSQSASNPSNVFDWHPNSSNLPYAIAHMDITGYIAVCPCVCVCLLYTLYTHTLYTIGELRAQQEQVPAER